VPDIAYSLPLLLPGRRRFLAPSTPCGWKSVFQMRWGGGACAGVVGRVIDRRYPTGRPDNKEMVGGRPANTVSVGGRPAGTITVTGRPPN
jgi:hypothetical protein